MKVSLSVVTADGSVRHASEGVDEVTLSWRGAYELGDRIVLRCSEARTRLVMKLDACLAESHVLLCGGTYEFPIPQGEAQKGYGKGWAFADERHWAFVRVEDSREAGCWRNLALNAHDLTPGEGVLAGGPRDAAPALFPHASTNAEPSNPQFAARNAIDGVSEAQGHGSWPHESWGVAGRADAWLQVDFGEPVVADELRLFLRADFPHDTCWEQATVTLSDGTELALELAKTGARQAFPLGGRTITWLRLHDLVKRDEDGFPGLSQLEVWGHRA